VDAWPNLPEPIRKGIVAIIQTCEGGLGSFLRSRRKNGNELGTKMATQRQIEANRRNWAKRRGFTAAERRPRSIIEHVF